MLIIDETRMSWQYKDVPVGSIFENDGAICIKSSITVDASSDDRYAICLNSGLPMYLSPDKKVCMFDAELILKTYTGDDYC